jgi:thiol:disulfide interchange protein DsbC
MSAFVMMMLNMVVYPGNIWAQCPEPEKLQESIRGFSKKEVEVKEVRPAAVPGLCEVQFRFKGKNQILYSDAEGKYVILGQIVEVASGRNISREAMEALMRLTPKELEELKPLVAFTAGESGKDIYYVTDPQCPYCKKGEELFKKLVEAGEVKVHYLLFPLKFHKGAKEQSISVICDDKGLEGFHNGYKSENQCEEGKKKVEDTIAFMNKKGITGTPAYIFPDGPYRVGVQQEKTLRKLLGLPEAEKEKPKAEVIKKEGPGAKKEPQDKEEKPEVEKEEPKAQKEKQPTSQ